LSSRAIGWFGGGYYSHVDCVLSDGRLLGARSDAVGGQKPGVRIRQQDYEVWQRRTLIRIAVTAYQYCEWMRFLEAQLGKPYDRTAIWAFALDRDWREQDSWICSELASRSIEMALGLELALPVNKIDPGACSLVASALGKVVEDQLLRAA